MSDKLNVLALAPYPEAAASTRFRIAQFIPLLAEQGIHCELKPFISDGLFKGLYRQGRLARKAVGMGWSALARLRDLVSAGSWDVVFVQREAALVGPPLVERALVNIFRKP